MSKLCCTDDVLRWDELAGYTARPSLGDGGDIQKGIAQNFRMCDTVSVRVHLHSSVFTFSFV